MYAYNTNMPSINSSLSSIQYSQPKKFFFALFSSFGSQAKWHRGFAYRIYMYVTMEMVHMISVDFS